MNSVRKTGLVLATALCASLAFAGAPSMNEIEKSARAKWFAFELEPVQTTFHGDWAAFAKQKEAEEARFAEQARKAPARPRYGPAPSVEQARAQRVLQAEFGQVAKARTEEIRAMAKAVIEALQKGDVEALVDDCAMYDASSKDRAALTRAFLVEHRAELMKMAKLADPSAPDFARDLAFTAPSPHTGMTGQVNIAFGPPGAAPKDPEMYPARHELELWWSGEVMPEANGPLHATPSAQPPKSRWRFYQVIAPYSLKRMHLQ